MLQMNTPRQLALLAIMILITLGAYSNHFHNPFEFDDEHTIVTNEHIRQLSNIPSFFKDPATTSSLPRNQAYRPGLTTLNAIDYWIGGKPAPDPFYYHLSIFISFIILGILLAYFFRHFYTPVFGKTPGILLGVLGAAWFCLHTANAETINYIIARADSFSTLMVVLAFIMYIYLPRLRKFYLYLLPLIMGFMVKEPAIMFVPILFVYKLLFEQKKTWKELFVFKKDSPLLKVFLQTLVPFGTIVLLFVFSRKMTPAHWSSGADSTFNYFISQPYSILHYFNNFILPVNLVVDTDWTPVTRIWDDKVLIGAGFILALLAVIAITWKKHPVIAFGFSWFLLALLPTSSIFPLAEVINDHRPFFPYIGLVMVGVYLAGWALKTLEERKNKKGVIALSIALLTVLAAHAWGTHSRNHVWSSAELLWKEATILSPNSGRVWMNYGNTQMAKMNYEEAENSFQKARALWPNYSYVYINLGVLKASTGKPEEAEAYFKFALACDSLNPECYVYYANFLFNQNRMKDCNLMAEKGLALSPQHERLLAIKTKVDPYLKNPDQVLETKLSIALENAEKNPTHENYLQLSLEYYNLGKYQECIDACNKALNIKPDYDLAFNNICSAYIQLGEWELAINACEKGIRISPGNKLLQGNLDYAKQQKQAQQ